MNKLKYQHSSYTLTEWTEINPIIVKDEIVIEKGINNEADKLKIGDGINNYLSLPYFKIESEKLDFLLVDSWTDEAPSEIENHYTVLYGTTILDVYAIYKYKNSNGVCIAGQGSNPFVPISQTTIFVHPTTFERYRFNGTSMEVYDDVDGVVPKWLKYEALLSQSGEDAPVARVLNQDERDYLGDIVYTVPDMPHLYKLTLPFVLENTIVEIGDILNSSNWVPVRAIYNILADKYSHELNIHIINGMNEFADLIVCDVPISFRKRLRGAPPKLLSAETNTAGNKVILTFNKKMSGYKILQISYALSNNLNDFDYSLTEYKDTQITFIFDGNFTLGSTDNLMINYDATNTIESFDYGLLQMFENFPVTNNVSA